MSQNRPNLNPSLFWDTNFETIDWQKSDAYAIERVVCLGGMEDWKEIQSFYGLPKIREVALAARWLDDKTLNYLSVFFNVPKEEFRCYTYRQSVPQHYPF